MGAHFRKATFIALALILVSSLAGAASNVDGTGRSGTPGDLAGRFTDGLIDGQTHAMLDVGDVVSRVPAGGVLIISEQHGNQTHYTRQREALGALSKTGRCVVSVGLEFLTWPYQEFNAPYLAGQISEAEFLMKAKWPGNPFADYRDQARFPLLTGGQLVSINAPDDLEKAIARVGIAGLTGDQSALMPPGFRLGSAAYRERFDAVMATHVPPSALDRYFEAQSARDESMAWKIHDFLRANPNHCLAVIVGDFHAAWGGGLPDSLRARGVTNLTVISQIETGGMSPGEVSAEVGPHPTYGIRSDAVWLSSSGGSASP